ncbi:hypothetical protein CK203_048222 [Vitis vinifera]|uniref:Reverse transcriptase domain-containing protein n=1 Tax=Vitis vinifera TaxID=29760 RepID=A0A438H3X4_VITVI|nr:hypothetical protein CK203_048222 [Vitis vinifera]
MEGGFISGCKIQRNRGRAVHIAHLLFADDTIVFCEAKKEYLTNLSWILFWFEAASGLKINLAKSEVYSSREFKDRGAGCGVRRENEKEACSLEEPIYIKGGRITLIKSTMGSMPVYQMSLFRMPMSMRFLASGLGDLLRIRRPFETCAEAKYGQEDHGWRPRRLWGVWCGGVEGDIKGSCWCWDKMGFKVGKGNKISFWTDVWCGDSALSQRFPHLYTLAANRNAKIEDL